MKTVLFGEHEYTGNADALSAARVVMAIRVLVLHRNTRFHQGPTSEFCSLGQEVSQKDTMCHSEPPPMLSPVIKDLLYRAKALLLSIPAVAAVNRVHKAHQLRTGLQRLEARYAKQTLEEGLTYQEEELVAEFRRHVVVARPNVYPKKAGELRIFWVGANRMNPGFSRRCGVWQP
jgi:hypothetical protein